MPPMPVFTIPKSVLPAFTTTDIPTIISENNNDISLIIDAHQCEKKDEVSSQKIEKKNEIDTFFCFFSFSIIIFLSS